jgi:hypothetical protein
MGAKPLKTVGDFDRDEIHELAMRSIVHDPARFQTRAEIDMEVVNAWVKAVRLFQSTGGKEGSPLTAWPPVLVKELPDGTRFLSDGFHRWALYEKLRKSYIRAIIEPGEDEGDVLLKGIKANLDNLKFRAVTEADRVHAVKQMIRSERFRDWPDNGIARICGFGASASVTRIRLRLATEEGIPLPERVKRLRKDGSWTGQTSPYRLVTPSGKPRLQESSSPGQSTKYSASIKGENIYLGRDKAKAIARLDSLLADVSQFHDESRSRFAPTTSHGFLIWLTNRGIPGYCNPQEVSICQQGVAVKGARLFPVSEMTLDAFLRTIGVMLIYRKHAGETASERMIVVGYLRGCPSIGRILSVLDSEPFPIEHLTPEQLLAEFGPRPDGPTATAGQP